MHVPECAAPPAYPLSIHKLVVINIERVVNIPQAVTGEVYVILQVKMNQMASYKPASVRPLEVFNSPENYYIS